MTFKEFIASRVNQRIIKYNLKVSKMTIWNWTREKHKPSAPRLRAIEELFGIVFDKENA